MRTKIVCREAILAKIDSSMNQVIQTAKQSTHKVDRICAHTDYKIGTVGWLFKLECKTRNFFFFINKDEVKALKQQKLAPVVTQYKPF